MRISDASAFTLPEPSTRDRRQEFAAGDGAGALLLVRLSAIGDIVHSLPTAAVLGRGRATRSSGRCSRPVRPLIAGNPGSRRLAW
jgi:hypothetical protein